MSGQRDIDALAAGALTALVGRFLGRGLGFVAGVVIARGLGPALFGIYGLALTFLRIGKLVVTLGLDKGVVNFGRPLWQRDAAALGTLIRRALAISVAAGTVLGALLYWAAPAIERIMADEGLASALRIVAFVLPFAALLAVAAASTRVTSRLIFSVAAEDVSQTAVHLTLASILIALGFGVTGALTALAVSFAVASVVAVVLLLRLVPSTLAAARSSEPRSPQRHTPESGTPEPGAPVVDTRELLSFSLLASIGLTFTLLAMWLDKLVIGYFRSQDEVGIYMASAQLASLFPMVLNAFAAILWPLFAEHASRKDYAPIKRLYRIAVRWSLIIAVPAFLVLIFERHRIIELVYDARYVAGATPLLILAVGQLLNAATGPVGPLLLTTGSKWAWFKVSAAALIGNIGLNIALVPRWGMTGAAVATALSTALLFGGGLVVAYRRLGLVPFDRHALRLVIAALVSSAALYGMGQLSPHLGLAAQDLAAQGPAAQSPAAQGPAAQGLEGATAWLGLVVSGVVGGAAFLAVIALFPLAPDERDLRRRLLSRLRARFS